MIRILPSLAAALAACTSAPQETLVQSSSRNAATSSDGLSKPEYATETSGNASDRLGMVAQSQERAAVGPGVEPVSAAENPLSAPPADSPAAARGRRTLSTAFVRVGADGHLTVELHNGRALVLRDVAMRRKDYCGVQVLGVGAGARYCGKYAEVVAARPGGAPRPATPDLAPPNPLPTSGGSAETD